MAARTINGVECRIEPRADLCVKAMTELSVGDRFIDSAGDTFVVESIESTGTGKTVVTARWTNNPIFDGTAVWYTEADSTLVTVDNKEHV